MLVHYGIVVNPCRGQSGVVCNMTGTGTPYCCGEAYLGGHVLHRAEHVLLLKTAAGQGEAHRIIPYRLYVHNYVSIIW